MRLKTALKYCGGCDPAYDRQALVAQIKAVAGKNIEWLSLDDPEHEAVLLVCGCKTACPLEKYQFKVPPVVVRDQSLSAARIAARLMGNRK